MKSPTLKPIRYYFLFTCFLIQAFISTNATAQAPHFSILAPVLTSCACQNEVASVSNDQPGYIYNYAWTISNLCPSTSIGGQGTYAVNFELQSTSLVVCTITWADPSNAANSGTGVVSATVPIDNITAKVSGPTKVNCSGGPNVWVATYSGATVGPIHYTWYVPPGWSTPGNTNIYAPAVFGASGTITVVISDNLCFNVATINVTTPTPPTVKFTGTPVTDVCTSSGPVGESYSIAPVAGATYHWSVTRMSGIGFANITSGQGTPNCSITYSGAAVYSVCAQVTDVVSGCTMTGESCITVTTENSIPADPISVRASCRIQCPDRQWNLVVTPVSGATSYVWSSTNANFPLTNLVTSGTFNTCDINAYSQTSVIKVWAQNACGISKKFALTHVSSWSEKTCVKYTHEPIKPSDSTQAEDEALMPEIQDMYSLYPSPASTTLTIENLNPGSEQESTEVTMVIYNILGEKIVSWNVPKNQDKITEDISALKPGMYFYTIGSGNNSIQRGKLMIQR